MRSDTVPAGERAWPGPNPSDEPVAAAVSGLDEKQWLSLLSSYREPRLVRALIELATTALPFFALWAAVMIGLHYGYLLSLLLTIPAAGFLVRLFMIQHDCGHGSFFGQRQANDWVGRVIGVLTLTPYEYWRRCHAIHHASSAHLERRGIGDLPQLTVQEYVSSSRWRRIGYRLVRNPLVLLGIAPIYLFFVKHRVPIELMDGGKDVWISAMATNLAITGAFLGAGMTLGFGSILLVHVPIMVIASSIGVWLFYVQHQFEDTWWADGAEWSFHKGAMRGSSHLDLPAPLRWLTANIGIHHVHHLVSRIPSYRLGEVLRDYPQLRALGRLTLGEALGCFRFVLWDEQQGRLVSFRELRASRRALAIA
jgi:omega-6 fatty acid desaturase (delta-12 desaturase)